MITLTVDRFKDTFFDRDSVQRAVDKAQFASLKKGGASIRLIARRSIRRRKKPSAPGQPPSSRKGQLKELLFSRRKGIPCTSPWRDFTACSC